MAFDAHHVAAQLGLSEPDLHDMVKKLDHFTSTLNPNQQAALQKASEHLHKNPPTSQPEIQKFLDTNTGPKSRPIVMGVFVALQASKPGR